MSKQHTDGIDVGDAIVSGVISKYDRIPRYLYNDDTLGMGEFVTYAVLLRFAGMGQDSGRGAFPGIETIATQTRSSTASVKRRLAQLKKRGWLSVKRRGLNQTNLYRVHAPHPQYPELGSGITDEELRKHLEAQQIEPSREVNLSYQDESILSYQESADLATNTKRREYKESEHEENLHHPLTPSRGKRDDVFFLSDDSAPTSQESQRTRRKSRYARESDHEFWQGDHGAAHLQRFNYLWVKHPRQEAKLEAMRAWREVLGDDALNNDLMRVILKTFEEATWSWASYTAGLEPLLSTWLMRRDWEESSEYPSDTKRARENATALAVAEAENLTPFLTFDALCKEAQLDAAGRPGPETQRRASRPNAPYVASGGTGRLVE